MAYTSPNVQTSGESFATLQKGGLTATIETLITVNGGATSARGRADVVGFG